MCVRPNGLYPKLVMGFRQYLSRMHDLNFDLYHSNVIFYFTVQNSNSKQ